jgi:hypothetical protein
LNNFCRIHQMLRITPAMQAGIADHICSLQELVGLLERRTEGVSMKRWPTVAAAIAGAVVAFFVEITVGTALSLRTSLPTAAKVSLVIRYCQMENRKQARQFKVAHYQNEH